MRLTATLEVSADSLAWIRQQAQRQGYTLQAFLTRCLEVGLEEMTKDSEEETK